MKTKTPNITLVLLGSGNTVPVWRHGKVLITEPAVASVASIIEEQLAASQSDAWFFWDPSLGAPDPDGVLRAMQLPGDLWHAGLRLGTTGLPSAIDYVNPTWMLNRDPDPAIEATSWRISLRCALVRTSVLRQMGGLNSDFSSLDAAALEMGHRYVTRGVIIRHIPSLAPEDARARKPVLSTGDELRFVYYRFGKKWLTWAFMRMMASGEASRTAALNAFFSVRSSQRPALPAPYKHEINERDERTSGAKVSVIIPTVDRYPYLHTLLGQLRSQTVRPHEIIVIDQTSQEFRQTGLKEMFPDLPLTVLYMDKAGQCSSRNAGLQHSTGDYILFLDDDDDKLPPTLVESHLQTLHSFRAGVSSGVVQEVGIDHLPEEFTFLRASDVFPTNNTLVRREVLYKSGLFDLAYETGVRADGDLGMRVYLTGALMALNPNISLLHHRAPSGGLRKHKARVVTYAASKKSLTLRHLPHPTEAYLLNRYFSQQQVEESIRLRALGSLFTGGGAWRKILRLLAGIVLLPDTFRRIRESYVMGKGMMKTLPMIPQIRERQQESQVQPSVLVS